MKIILLMFAFASLITTGTGDFLTGKWESKPSVKGNVTGVIFKPDNTYVGYVNKKTFVNGTYSLMDSIISINENGCEGLTGVYKTILFSNADSLKFQPVNDSCEERKAGMSSIVLGRVK